MNSTYVAGREREKFAGISRASNSYCSSARYLDGETGEGGTADEEVGRFVRDL